MMQLLSLLSLLYFKGNIQIIGNNSNKNVGTKKQYCKQNDNKYIGRETA